MPWWWGNTSWLEARRCFSSGSFASHRYASAIHTAECSNHPNEVRSSIWRIQLQLISVQGSMWRFGFDVPPNYNDMSNYCGGKENQWTTQKGRCGVCGDPFQGRSKLFFVVPDCWSLLSGPRDHEDGGVYATDLIGRTYESGEMINTTIDITANHFGYFEFRLCPLNMGGSRRPRRLTQSCLDQHLLTIGPSDSKSNGDDTRYYLPHGNKSYFYVPVQLPAEIISCIHCVLQWKYHAGNTWGKDQKGRKCLGCSDQQEEFYNCADIAIIERSPNELSTISNLDNSTMANHCDQFRPSSLFLSIVFSLEFFVASFWLCTFARRWWTKDFPHPIDCSLFSFFKIGCSKIILLIEENQIFPFTSSAKRSSSAFRDNLLETSYFHYKDSIQNAHHTRSVSSWLGFRW